MHGTTVKFLDLVILHVYPLLKIEQGEFSKTLAYKIQTPGNYPEESIKQFEFCVHKIFLSHSKFLPSLC